MNNLLNSWLITFSIIIICLGLLTKKTFADEICEPCKALDGFVSPDNISREIRLMVGKVGFKCSSVIFGEASCRSLTSEAVEIQERRGVTETGLETNFGKSKNCPEIDSETWAKDYSYKRPWLALHKGVDIPQPEGTAVLAIADGTVVGKFMNEGNRKGIEVMLRHLPEQTGLPFWTYSQYTHLFDLPKLPIGHTVKMGDVIGETSNTGKMGRRERRDALHFAILYSEVPDWTNTNRAVIPRDGYWMDPIAFYRKQPPYDSKALKTLPSRQKEIFIPHIRGDGTITSKKTKRIWPYRCEEHS
ncbi:MAG: hypothetical protein CMM76_12345 [Rhodospirillaceae bacterium]|nr:hypothetical protein [Rhodospirillaceae bacterium]